VFSLGDTTVGEVMTPRVDIVGLERDAPWSEVVARVRSAGHSRVVVHDGDLDGIEGILYAKDLLPFVVDDTVPPGGWQTLVRPAVFIPAGKAVDDQLRDFRASGVHIAIVADEFGGTAGLVTIEDLLELIVGAIRDEHDDDEPEFVREGDRVWASGGITLDQLSDLVGEPLQHDDVTTLGGLAYEVLGRVPRAGESVRWRGWRLVIERVRRRRVERVFLERLPGVADGEDA
jgi:CBS domain containing-hemolysin-like protein